MTIPWWVVITVGCVVYLVIGYCIALAFTLDGPPEWWLRVLTRLALLFLWLPLIILIPVMQAIGGLFT